MKIYNTLTNKIEEFKPIKPKQVNMYVCGPTVYDLIHIGNARPLVFFDLVKNYLTFSGYQVYYVSNITDVDDKIINKAKEFKTQERVITQKYEHAYLETLGKLNANLPDLMPHATDFINQMIKYINELIASGFAYQTASGVYFRIRKSPNYGMISNQKLDQLINSVRIQSEPDKEYIHDFALWKITEDGLSFDAPFGRGRPGWHTECAVMNHEIFEGMIDIHGGGSDLKFPHHENEVAQAQAHSHHHIANYWVHVGFLDLNDEKMSKSLGNTIWMNDLIESYSAESYRLLVFAHHYRAPINYTEELIEQYQKMYERISYTMNRNLFYFDLENIKDKTLDEVFMKDFIGFMDYDFNTPNVISLLEEGLKRLNKETSKPLFNAIMKVLEILGIRLKINRATASDFKLYQDWIDARNQKDFQKADRLRKHFQTQGWI